MIQIGTRKSELALWQANQVKDHLKKIGHASKLVAIESLGDKNLVQPIYSMGIKGVFTKSLDIALINNKIDIAIHSLKDVPTILPKEIEISAYLKRDNPYDIVVYNPNFVDFLSNGFKLRTTGTAVNGNGGTYIYMAFAEQPGTTSFETFPNSR